MGEESAILLEWLRDAGALKGESPLITPLAGGVSSDIHLVRDGERVFVVKRALEKLKVAEDWRSDPGRNRHEQRYLRYVASFLPRSVPRILFGSEENGWFAMEYFGDGFVNWKSTLLQGQCDQEAARGAMSLLARVHNHSRGQTELAREFDTTKNFHQLRTDPYLLATAGRHPALASLLEAEVTRLEGRYECLVHGDFSPKNILLSVDRQILLDCEVAWYGDPAFDLAFFLNHLLLKALYHAPREPGFRTLFDTAMKTYSSSSDQTADEVASLDRRSARLLLMLMLARIDGKSPVEYIITEEKKEAVRQFVLALLPGFQEGLREVAARWFMELRGRFGGL